MSARFTTIPGTIRAGCRTAAMRTSPLECELSRDRLITLFCEHGCSDETIALRFGTYKSEVQRLRVHYGIHGDRTVDDRGGRMPEGPVKRRFLGNREHVGKGRGRR